MSLPTASTWRWRAGRKPATTRKSSPAGKALCRCSISACCAPSVLIDINRIAGLAFIEDAGACIRIGALTRHFQLETSPVIARHLPVLPYAMTHVAHLAIRNRGTIGGSLSHADPAAELPMMALLLDAELHITSGTGKRTVAARDFFLDALTVDLDADELSPRSCCRNCRRKPAGVSRKSRAARRFRARGCRGDADDCRGRDRRSPHRA